MVKLRPKLEPKLNPLLKAGWQNTPGGRWVDPQSGKSYSTDEAWGKLNERNPRRKP
jgi:hypothetical protein